VTNECMLKAMSRLLGCRPKSLAEVIAHLILFAFINNKNQNTY
jgi:hypothetical protein